MSKTSSVNSKHLRNKIVSGSLVLLSGSTLTTVVNLAYNIAAARFLGPQGYGHVTVVYTMLTIIAAVTLSFQIVAAKVVAQQGSPENKSAAYRFFHRSAWTCGLFVGVVLLLFRQSIADYLRLPSPLLVILLAVGAAFYIPLGTRRGYVQGAFGFRKLATSLVTEALVRLVGSVVAVMAGFGVTGVIAANSAAMAIAWLALPPHLTPGGSNPLGRRLATREVAQALVFFSGQVLINNSDIVLVKHFFTPAMAGLYAAVAMVGRVMFSFSQAVMNSMFPVVAGTRHEDRKSLSLITTSLLLVLSIGACMAIVLRLLPPSVWTAFFGSGFRIAGPHGLPYLLSLRAVVTVVFSMSVIVIAYEMSYKIANTSWVQLAIAIAVIAGICRFHTSLREVLLVQLVLMALLFLLVGLPFLVAAVRNAAAEERSTVPPVRLLSRVPEDAVIAEFLRSDFENPAYRDYHETMRDLVLSPDLEDAEQNARRRALLFVRHRALWKEIPQDTEWFEAEVRPSHLERVRVFPRAQWLRIARGDFRIAGVAEKIGRIGAGGRNASLARKIDEIRSRLADGQPLPGAVMLIGISENEPMTVLDGNHRFVAAVMDRRIHQLRFLCGISPKMHRCCWYRTNLLTLSRYGRNVIQHLIYHPEAEVERLSG